MTNIEKENLGETIVQLYKEDWNMRTVSEKMNISRISILRYLTKYHKELIKEGKKCRIVKPTTRTYFVNENYFNRIDTPNKAYILGFLYADGYNNEKNGSLQISLQNRDIVILEKIKRETESTCNIKNYDTYCHLTINSRKLSNDLNKWGCHQAKSFTLRFPDFLSDDLMSHFIRGYFDGDGCVQTFKTSRTTIISYIGNVEFLNSLNAYLSGTLNIKNGGIRTYEKCQHKIGELRFGKREIVKSIKDFMYHESTFHLERKLDKFKIYDL